MVFKKMSFISPHTIIWCGYKTRSKTGLKILAEFAAPIPIPIQNIYLGCG